jgi:pyruvate/2-oxoglutarate dehydrogenase complex dihydrolipoamide acyltransferase (E2) component
VVQFSSSSLKRDFPLPTSRLELVLPDLGLGDAPVLVSVWLVEVGAEVTEGDRLLEVVAGAVTIDLPSPASGTLTEILVDEDQQLLVGQALAVVLTDDS